MCSRRSGRDRREGWMWSRLRCVWSRSEAGEIEGEAVLSQQSSRDHARGQQKRKNSSWLTLCDESNGGGRCDPSEGGNGRRGGW